MPQFDFANVFVPQLFWLAVFFVVLYFGIVRLTLPRLGKTMDQRAAKIDGDLEAARQAKDAADELTVAWHADMDNTREQARAHVVAAKSEAAKVNEARIGAADAQSAARIEEAEARIAAAVAEARASVREVATESARDIVAKLTGREPSTARVAAAVDASLARASQDR